MGRPGRRRSPGADPDPDDGSPAIYFLSDYGADDEFVGVVHAVLHRMAAQVRIIDLGHGVPPFDIAAGAAMLVRCAPYLGNGVVLAVVDPGVGTDRRGVAVEVAGRGPGWLVGPDNGLLEPLARTLGGLRRVVELRSEARLPAWWPDRADGRTFDGRDLFAPAAAHLALGVAASELGHIVDPASLVPLGAERPLGGASGGPGEIDVHVSWVDRFGNVQLGTGAAELDAIGLIAGASATVVALGTRPAAGAVASRPATPDRRLHPRARRVDAFADLGEGEPGLIVDSNGRVALVLREESAAVAFRLGVGDVVRIGVADEGVPH